ncbi:MAG: SDR family NAD(P)-dependent oxidoreductase [Hyphomicrobiaceae bacterium]
MSRPNIFVPGQTAVVTGAALGIGRAMSKRFAERGLIVVMVDLPGADFDDAVKAARAVAEAGPDSVIALPTDVADPAAIGALRAHVLAQAGQINVLANNAVTRIGRGFDADVAEWRRAMAVNLWGPVQTVDALLPDLLAQDGPAAIINAGSKQGITNPPGHPIYNMTKSALKTYTEALEHHLRNLDGNDGAGRVTAHLLVPGWTTTGKAEHKPGAWLPEQVVDTMIAAVSDGDFYIVCPDGETTPEMDNKRILWGAGDITENRPPLSRWHPDFAQAAKDAGA